MGRGNLGEGKGGGKGKKEEGEDLGGIFPNGRNNRLKILRLHFVEVPD